MKKLHGLDNTLENRTNVAASLEKMSTGRLIENQLKSSIEVKLNTQSIKNESPLATYGSFSKLNNKNEHFSEFKSKRTTFNLRKFSITQIKTSKVQSNSP